MERSGEHMQFMIQVGCMHAYTHKYAHASIHTRMSTHILHTDAQDAPASTDIA